MKTFYIGLGKDNEIVAATLDCKSVAQDIKDFVDEGLKVLKVQAESITIGNYWGYQPQKSKIATELLSFMVSNFYLTQATANDILERFLEGKDTQNAEQKTN